MPRARARFRDRSLQAAGQPRTVGEPRRRVHGGHQAEGAVERAVDGDEVHAGAAMDLHRTGTSARETKTRTRGRIQPKARPRQRCEANVSTAAMERQYPPIRLSMWRLHFGSVEHGNLRRRSAKSDAWSDEECSRQTQRNNTRREAEPERHRTSSAVQAWGCDGMMVMLSSPQRSPVQSAVDALGWRTVREMYMSGSPWPAHASTHASPRYGWHGRASRHTHRAP
jgi:hypothetical protein